MSDNSANPKNAPLMADIAELGNRGFALALQILRNREDAADAVQDSIHAAMVRWNTFDDRKGTLQTWFLKIVRNRCLDFLRRRNRRMTENAELGDVTSIGQIGPDIQAENNELVRLVKAELMAMPQEQREIIMLRDYHQLSYGEIAEVLSIPAGTVMSRLHRARSELRNRMKKYR